MGLNLAVTFTPEGEYFSYANNLIVHQLPVKPKGVVFHPQEPSYTLTCQKTNDTDFFFLLISVLVI